MQEFIAKHQDKIAGTLSGFDRLVFRGHLRSIGHPQGMMTYLWFNQVLLKNFGDHVAEVTERLKEASLAEAKAYGRPVNRSAFFVSGGSSGRSPRISGRVLRTLSFVFCASTPLACRRFYKPDLPILTFGTI